MRMKKLHRYFLLAVSLFLITLMMGCAKGPATQAGLSAEDYLSLSATATGADHEAYQLSAAEKFLETRQVKSAKVILDRVQLDALTPELSIRFELLKAQYQVATHHNDAAVALLQRLSTRSNLSSSDQFNLHQMMAKAYSTQGNLLASIQENSLAASFADSEQRQAILMSLWNHLETLSPASLQEWLSKASTPEQQGWIQLAIISNDTQIDTQQFIQKLEEWKGQYPDHPAKNLIS